MGNITFIFGPQQTQRALVAAGWTRNHARLVVRKFDTVEIPGAPYDNPIYGPLECNNPADPEDCSSPVIGHDTGNYPSTYKYKEIFKKISDSALAEDGSGEVSIAVPADAGYTLEVLTYFSDKENQPGVGATPTGLNYIVEYGKNHDGSVLKIPTTFDVAAGELTDVYVTLDNELAQLSLQDAVLAGAKYQVSVSQKSAALRNDWKVRQALDEGDLSTLWFTSTPAVPATPEVPGIPADLGVSGTGPITLTAPLKNSASGGAADPSWQLWHHGQFFISDHLLGAGDDFWTKWTFGTSFSGLLNPLGSINVVQD
jgi:hypothetical protein